MKSKTNNNFVYRFPSAIGKSLDYINIGRILLYFDQFKFNLTFNPRTYVHMSEKIFL